MTDTAPPRLTEPALATAVGVRHAFFTREGGVSTGLYSSLNVGFGSGDDRAAIAENRRRALACFDLPAATLDTVFQVHGTAVALADRHWDPADAPRADALATDRPGIALGILTADCVPVLFAGQAAGGRPVIGAAHAGWRGAIAGVLEETVAAMRRLGAEPGTIRAAIGPCIGARSYEVGPEFAAPFLAQDPANARFFAPGRRDGHPLFDIAGYVADRLARLGLAGVGRIAADTCAEDRRFFSYRRSTLHKESDYGRELSAIVIAG